MLILIKAGIQLWHLSHKNLPRHAHVNYWSLIKSLNMTRLVALLLAYLFLALAIVGVFLPGLPTVPFLLLTAWFSAKGSERLHRWLYAHPHFGKLLIDWENQRAISQSSKVIALLMLTVSWVVMYQRIDNIWVLAGMTILLISIMAYLLCRPEPHWSWF